LEELLQETPRAKGGGTYQERFTGSVLEPVKTLTDIGIVSHAGLLSAFSGVDGGDHARSSIR